MTVQTASPPRWSADRIDYTGEWYLRDDQRWDDRYVSLGLSREEAEYAATLLNAGYIEDDDDTDLFDFEDLILESVARQACTVCRTVMFVPQLDASGRCRECQP